MKQLQFAVASLLTSLILISCSSGGGSDAKIDFIAGVQGGETICYYPDRNENSIELGINAHGITKIVYPCVNGYFSAAEKGAMTYVFDKDARLFKFAEDGKSECIASGYYHIGFVNDGRVPAVKENEPIVILNTEGEEVFTAGPVDDTQVAEVAPIYSEGLLWFRLKNNREGYFDKDGNVKILLDENKTISSNSENKFERNFHNGFVVVRDHHNWYFMNKKGELSAPIPYNEDESAIRYKKGIIVFKTGDLSQTIAAYDDKGKNNAKALEAFNKTFAENSKKDLKASIQITNEFTPPFNMDWLCKKFYAETEKEGNNEFVDAMSFASGIMSLAIESQGDAVEKAEYEENEIVEIEETNKPRNLNSLAIAGLLGSVKSVSKGSYTDEYDVNGELSRRTAYGNEYDKRTYSSPTVYKDNQGEVTIIITENSRKETGANDYLRGTYTFDNNGRIIKAHCLMDMEYVDIVYTYDGDNLLPSTVTTTGGSWNAIEKYSYIETDNAGNWIKAKITTTTTSEGDEVNDGDTETRTETVSRTITYWE